MSHVASSDFYAQVQKEILTAKQDGFVLFFEWVRPGSEESGDAFNKALGIEFNPELYNNFSKLYGIVAQNNDDFLRIVNDKDYNVDLSLDEVMDIYDRKQELSKAVWEQTDTPKTQALDINSELIRTLSSLSEKQLLLLRFLNQSFMNFMMKNEALRDTLITKIGNTDIFAVILDDRNEYLVEEILNSEHDKVHILYGLMHFKGVLDILQSRDPRWRIIETQSYQVVSQSS